MATTGRKKRTRKKNDNGKREMKGRYKGGWKKENKRVGYGAVKKGEGEELMNKKKATEVASVIKRRRTIVPPLKFLSVLLPPFPESNKTCGQPELPGFSSFPFPHRSTPPV